MNALASLRRRPVLILAWSGAVVALALVLALLWALGPGAKRVAVRTLSGWVHLPVRVDGPFSLTPGFAGVAIRASGVHVGQAKAFGPGDVVVVDRGEADLPWSALFGVRHVSRLVVDGMRADLRRDVAGRPNWSNGRPTAAAFALPRIERVEVSDAKFTLDDRQEDLSFQGAVATGADGELTLAGQGTAKGASPWSARMATPATVTDAPTRPLTIQVELQTPAGRSEASFEGEVGGRGLKGRLQGDGPDLHDLADVTRLPLPHTPAYRLAAEVDRAKRRVELTGVSGTVGRSDLSGRLTVTPTLGGRKLDGAFRSASLRMADLLSVASGGQLAGAKTPSGRLLPSGRINAAPLRKLSGSVVLDAASVQSRAIRSLRLVTTFHRGRVAFEPLDMRLAAGRATLRLVLDVRGPTPALAFDGRLVGVDTAELFAGHAPAVQAVFDVSARLDGSGASLAQAAAQANGEVDLHALAGRITALPAAVLGHDLLEGLAAVTDRAHAGAALRCAVARFKVADGVARPQVLALATAAGGATGSGEIDLRSETVDLTFKAAPAVGPDLTSVRLAGPLSHLQATLTLNRPGRILGGALNLLHPGAKAAPSACG